MDDVPVVFLLVYYPIALSVFFGIPAWITGRIARRAGFSFWYGFLALVPVVNWFLAWHFSAIPWPNEETAPNDVQGRSTIDD